MDPRPLAYGLTDQQQRPSEPMLIKGSAARPPQPHRRDGRPHPIAAAFADSEHVPLSSSLPETDLLALLGRALSQRWRNRRDAEGNARNKWR